MRAQRAQQKPPERREPIVIVGLKSIARECGCSKVTLMEWIEERAFPATKLNGTWRAVPEDVKQWFRGQAEPAFSGPQGN